MLKTQSRTATLLPRRIEIAGRLRELAFLHGKVNARANSRVRAPRRVRCLQATFGLGQG